LQPYELELFLEVWNSEKLNREMKNLQFYVIEQFLQFFELEKLVIPSLLMKNLLLYDLE
jgi:hypothetical protein